MATNPTYLIAKYVPDPVRMEPRNIGVVLWSRGGAMCRFMDASEATFVEDKKLFSRWTKFWSHACTSGAIQGKSGKAVSSTHREFLDAMRETQRGNFLLYEGGFLLDKIKASDRKAAADYLYRELVSAGESRREEVTHGSLKEQSDALFEQVGLTERDEFIDGYELELEAEGVVQPFKFDHAWAPPGALGALFQRVHLDLQQSTTNAAFLFEHAKESKTAKSAERYAMVFGDDSSNGGSSRRKLLEQLCDVIDVSDFPAAKRRLSRFVH